eukprot:TRINITY_DN3700_c0_g4_i1.p2 TRINITY_DN3700_c0_g4~~TRINITY_DN3700_c0_g4_i1.p2  ORF type:complete len:175 (+),score=1.73 TRINITY_DN3700_c0_g4_i1:489-1013(+)
MAWDSYAMDQRRQKIQLTLVCYLRKLWWKKPNTHTDKVTALGGQAWMCDFPRRRFCLPRSKSRQSDSLRGAGLNRKFVIVGYVALKNFLQKLTTETLEQFLRVILSGNYAVNPKNERLESKTCFINNNMDENTTQRSIAKSNPRCAIIILQLQNLLITLLKIYEAILELLKLHC